MTHEAAEQIVFFMRALLRSKMDDKSVAAVTDEIALLHDPGIAMVAAQEVVRTSDWFPTIRQFREAYHAVAKRTPSGALALPDPDHPTPEPHTQTEWERAGARARQLRAQQFGHHPVTGEVFPDPAAGTPLPRTAEEFRREWAAFARLRFGGSDLTRSIP